MGDLQSSSALGTLLSFHVTPSHDPCVPLLPAFMLQKRPTQWQWQQLQVRIHGICN